MFLNISRLKFWLGIISTIAVLCGSFSSSAHAQVTKLVVFGNSHADLGNTRDILEDNFNLFEADLEAIGRSEIPPWRYTFSSGNNMMQYLGAALDLPVNPVENYVWPNNLPQGVAPLGTNYAIGGAVVSADKQVERYLTDVNYNADPNAAYIMVFGTNHIMHGFWGNNTAQSHAYVDARLEELETGIRKLINYGAKHVYVFNVDAVGFAPIFDLLGNDNLVNDLVDYYNSELYNRVQTIKSQLGNHAKMFNFYGAVHAMRTTGRFGYSNTDAACNVGDYYMNLSDSEFDDLLDVIEIFDGEQSRSSLDNSNVRNYYTGGTYTTAVNQHVHSGPVPSCSAGQTETYMYYDLVHFSEKAHEDIAEILIDQVSAEGKCRQRTSTLKEHEDRVRAYSVTTSSWWSTTTTWYSMLGNDNLGTNGNSTVTLVDEDGSGNWVIGECSGPSAPTLVSKQAIVDQNYVTITGTASDPDNDIVEVTLRAPGVSQITCDGTTSFTCDVGGVAAGEYTLYLNVIDSTGLETGQVPVSFVVADPTPPEVTIESVTYQNKTITVTGTATDINNDITSITMALPGPYGVYCDVEENFTCSVEYDIADGIYPGRIIALDAHDLQAFAEFEFEIKSVVCVTSDNIAHIQAGRAIQTGNAWLPQAAAMGSNDSLGYASQYYNQTSSVQQTAENYWVKVPSCP